MAKRQPETNRPWTDEELALVVDDYFRMLAKQMAGESFNKTAHRRSLKERLPARSEGSIEFKHANISAALEEMGLDYIDGYKPRRNFQGALRDILAARATHAQQALDNALRVAESQEWAAPSRINADTVVPPPERDRTAVSDDARQLVAPWMPRFSRFVDWSAREARNRALGRAGEEFVVRVERSRLERAGKHSLARKIKHVAAEEGDGAGYDIASFEASGREKYIEVKTTVSGPVAPFHVSRNELEASRALGEQFVLARVFRFRTHARLFELRGCISDQVDLQPCAYLARVG